MKIKFFKDVEVDMIDKFEEVTLKKFRRGQIVEVVKVDQNGPYADVELPNGELLTMVDSSLFQLV